MMQSVSLPRRIPNRESGDLLGKRELPENLKTVIIINISDTNCLSWPEALDPVLSKKGGREVRNCDPCIFLESIEELNETRERATWASTRQMSPGVMFEDKRVPWFIQSRHSAEFILSRKKPNNNRDLKLSERTKKRRSFGHIFDYFYNCGGY